MLFRSAIYAYVILNGSAHASEDLRAELNDLVKKEIGSFAKPEVIHFTPELPKTRSGKIMRRILRKIANNESESIGDTSTLLNPEIVEQLIEDNKKLVA